MSISKFAVTRPVTMLMFLFGIIIIGIVCLQRLPVELMPNISYKKISVVVDIRGGMPPTEVESLVVNPVEEAMGTLTNLESIQSTSEKGRALVVLKFKPGTDMDFAAMEAREKFSKIKNVLPKEIEKPVIAKYEESDLPILSIAVTAIDNKYSPEVLRKFVDTKIKEVIQRVEGVANVEVAGGREQKILLEFDQPQLQKYKLPILRVINSLGVSNLNLMAGEIERSQDKLIIRTIGQFMSIDEIKELPIMNTPLGTIIRLKDVAEVKDSYMESESESRVNQNPVVSLYVQKESTGNTIQVCKSVEKALNELWPKLDPNIRKVVVSNQADFILDAIKNLNDSLLRGANLATFCLVPFLTTLHWAKIVFVLLIPVGMYQPFVTLLPTLIILFMILVVTRISRSTLIMSISLPTSVLLTFAFMLAKGITLNTMTLTGIALSIGMLTDSSIVVLDNIHVQRNKGVPLKDACIIGAQEMFVPLVASTSTTIVVFIPFIFVTEQIKLLYGQLAAIIVFSLIVSLVMAVTFVPLSASRLKAEEIPPLSKKAKKFYRKLLSTAIRYRYMVFMIPLLLGIIALWLGRSLETEFMGTTEESKFTIFVELPDGAKLEQSDRVVKAVETLLKKTEKAEDGTEKPLFPEIKNVSSWVKGWSSKVYVDLIALKDRKRSTKEVIEAVRPHLGDIEKLAVAPTGEKAFLYFSEPKGTGTNELFVDVYGHEYESLRKISYEMAGKMQAIEGLTDVKIRITEGRPELSFKIDKQKAALYGLNVRDISDMIHAQIRGLRATLFHSQGREIEVVGRLQEKYRRYRKDMPFLTLDTPKGEQVFLNQVSEFVPGMGPSEVWHINKRRMIQVSSNTGNMSLAVATEKIREVMKEIKLPKDFFWEFGGDYYLMIENRKQLTFCISLTILLVYMVLAALFESYTQPFIIMVTVPLAFIGVIFALKYMNKSVSMGVLIGGIMLSGIVVNNAIILVDKINSLKAQGYGLLHSVLTTGQDRLRPIAMTTITTILGLIPMAADKSEASDLWAPLAITVIGGLTLSTLLTLIIVPIIYTTLEDIKDLFSSN
jgi:HAE1 family hydrophobic/amphiphilic exporter-1